jgi:hypothetical protein
MWMCKDGERNMVEGLFVWFKQARSLNIPTQGKQSRLWRTFFWLARLLPLMISFTFPDLTKFLYGEMVL